MPETYTEAELAQAWKDLDTTLTDYNIDRLHRICIQARKNRLWEAQENEFAPGGIVPVPPGPCGDEAPLPPRNHPYPFSQVGVKVIRDDDSPAAG